MTLTRSSICSIDRLALLTGTLTYSMPHPCTRPAFEPAVSAGSRKSMCAAAVPLAVLQVLLGGLGADINAVCYFPELAHAFPFSRIGHLTLRTPRHLAAVFLQIVR